MWLEVMSNKVKQDYSFYIKRDELDLGFCVSYVARLLNLERENPKMEINSWYYNNTTSRLLTGLCEMNVWVSQTTTSQHSDQYDLPSILDIQGEKA